MAPLVVGLGQSSLDIIGQAGEYPALDQKAELSSLLMQGGGPVATALVTLARLGVATSMFGAVGDDQFGYEIRKGLTAEGVDCTHFRLCSGASSQVAFIAVDDDGHRNIFWHRGSAFPIVDDSFSLLLNDSVRVLHLDGLHLQPALAAAKLARAAGVTTVLDAGTLRPGILELLPWIDHLVVSEKFARQAVDADAPEAALQELLRYGAQAVTITLGKAGSLSCEAAGRSFHLAAFPVNAVDTTGCGDVFHGGYIYGLLQGWALAETVRFAAACAALKTRALGGRTAIPDLKTVTAFLQRSENQEIMQ